MNMNMNMNMKMKMKMSPWIGIALISALSVTSGLKNEAFASLSNLAGTKDGGGGKGVLCDGKLRTLDVYEAEEVYHLNPVPKLLTIEQNLAIYGSSLAAYWSHKPVDTTDPDVQREMIELVKSEILDRFSDIPPGSTLPPTQDATLPDLPKNCSMVQIAIYSDKDQLIYRDVLLWDMLSAHDQATLALHEGYYHAAREAGATTSDDTRRLIGLAMFAQTPRPLFEPFWKSARHLRCIAGIQDSEDEELFQFVGRNEVHNGQDGITLYANTIKSKVVAFRTTAFLPGVSIEDFEQPVSRKWVTQLRNQLSSFEWNFELDLSSPIARMRSWQDGEALPPFSEGFCFLE